MHRYGSHQDKVRGLSHYPTLAKTFAVFYAVRSDMGGEGVGVGGIREKRLKRGV